MTTHALTVDVENWYDGNLVNQDGTPRDHRVLAEMQRVLELLDRHNTRATFFVLGCLAEQHPQMVRAIAAAGHEVGCHGYVHDMVVSLSPERFAADLGRARKALQDATGQPINGFRAPSWSVSRASLRWVAPALDAAGFRYSSSIHPIWNSLYGIPAAPTAPWRHALPDGRTLAEIPPAVLRLGPVRVPVGGGAYWRLLPTWAVRQVISARRSPGCFYVHPWELNPVPAPVPATAGWVGRVATTVGVRGMMAKLDRLLCDALFAPIEQVYHVFLHREASA